MRDGEKKINKLAKSLLQKIGELGLIGIFIFLIHFHRDQYDTAHIPVINLWQIKNIFHKTVMTNLLSNFFDGSYN